MLARYVRSQKTPLTFGEAAGAMHAALSRKLGWGPARPVLALALAKTALETSRWQALYNHNWGNIKAGETYEGTYSCYACNEVLESGLTWFIPEGELDGKGGSVAGKVWLVPPGHPETRFRAYENSIEGAERYVDFVSSGRHREPWDALLLGDAIGYVHALKMKGYFTGEELAYARALVALTDEFARRLEWLPASEVAVPERDDIKPLVAPDPDVLVRVEATVAATEARYGELEELRRESRAGIIANDGDGRRRRPPGRVA